MREAAIRPTLVAKVREHEPADNTVSISHLLNRLQHHQKWTVEDIDEKCKL